jgi:hypothetical protein
MALRDKLSGEKSGKKTLSLRKPGEDPAPGLDYIEDPAPVAKPRPVAPTSTGPDFKKLGAAMNGTGFNPAPNVAAERAAVQPYLFRK